MTPPFTLRPAGPDDEPFLFALYCGTRKDEVDAWGFPPAQRDLFLRMQFNAQKLQYGQLPAAEHQLILLEGAPVGRLLVSRPPEELRLVDVALLPERRGGGLGTALLKGLQEEAARTGKPLRLQVLQGSPAARLYQRLGFIGQGENGPYLRMEWSAR